MKTRVVLYSVDNMIIIIWSSSSSLQLSPSSHLLILLLILYNHCSGCVDQDADQADKSQARDRVSSLHGYH